MNLKSERLKKFESELRDLEQWQKLGLVPKKDLQKHEDEINMIRSKIAEEKSRLLFLKESGEIEEYVPPKRGAQGRPLYQEPSMPGMEIEEEQMTDAGLDMETEAFESETTAVGEGGEETEEEKTFVEEEEEDPFSDRNRWKRGVWEDPDNEEW
jgi:hypothetical protein